jgi:hypothetical protein
MKTTFRPIPETVRDFSTTEILCALAAHGHDGHFTHDDTLAAMRNELRRRSEETYARFRATKTEEADDK